MLSRTLPPPPPPVHLRTWPDRQTMLTDRGLALHELRRRHLGVHRLLLLWLCGFGAVIGWALLVRPLKYIEDEDATGIILGPVLATLGLAALGPAVVGVVLGIRRDRRIRELTDAWLALDHHPVSDARLRSPGLSLLWLLSSLAVCALGLWASFAAPAYAEPGRDTYADVVLGMGAGLILWLTGLVGATKAAGHYRWALRMRAPAPAPSGTAR
ncbi:hypothetical protein GKQ77_05555 [Streptomyces sp. BG9H]|uniref:Uncharacterized protein n=1 Tax=Streptomyces anatolicus TaxID=2675858 RepID=A0ABS6YHZ9_9ACTN|nr:hypothetical protein [Streptomyces anatolicus]MBW5421033.1 hypothetical protein [Streptomyces anatolicus]